MYRPTMAIVKQEIPAKRGWMDQTRPDVWPQDSPVLCGNLREPTGEYLLGITSVAYIPKHGSWLNVVEWKMSCMTSQCLKDRRIGDLDRLQIDIAAWSTRVSEKLRAVDSGNSRSTKRWAN
ncbi:MAG: hypothetical protein IT427_10115 [Pirellulales bacterium]|nr:hypothetical protein [Pirellulales bacterium]